MLDYANYIQLDMYAADTYQFDTSIIVNSPANKNYMVSYTFGVYNSTLLKKLESILLELIQVIILLIH